MTDDESPFERVARKLQNEGKDVYVMTDDEGQEYIVEDTDGSASLYLNDDSLARTAYAVVADDGESAPDRYTGVSAVFLDEQLAIDFCDLMVEFEPRYPVYDIKEVPLFC